MFSTGMSFGLGEDHEALRDAVERFSRESFRFSEVLTCARDRRFESKTQRGRVL